jgi:hypothetical protein
MRVLVVEDEIGTSTEVILDLVDAGHRVVRCQPVGGEVTPCAGMSSPEGECPLTAPVDVVVQVHSGEQDLTMRELGVVCAGRMGTPIVNAGPAPSRVATVTAAPDRLAETLAALAPQAVTPPRT